MAQYTVDRLIGRIGPLFALVLGGTLTFAQSSSAQCLELAKLLPPTADASDFAGYDVDIDGPVAVLGAFGANGAGADAGAAHVFRFNQATQSWLFEQTLVSPNAAAGDEFGFGVAVNGNRIVVGARKEDVSGQVDQGAVHVFDFDGAVWNHQQRLVASVGRAGDHLGIDVDVEGDRLVVGAYLDDTTLGANAGSVFVFEKSIFGWNEVANLTALDSNADAYFGAGVALQSTNIVVGSPLHDASATNGGSIYLFQFDSVAKLWVERCRAAPANSAPNDQFGHKVAIDGNRVLAGSYLDDAPSSNSGSATLFEWDATNCLVEVQQFLPAAPGADDGFGLSVAIEGDVAVVGSYLDNHSGGSDNGSAYVFRRCRRSGLWYEDYQLVDSLSISADQFGLDVALSDGRALVGSYRDDDVAVDAGSGLVFGVRDLELSIAPPNVLAGQTATITSFCGRPQALVILYLVSFNGITNVFPLLTQRFDQSHKAAITTTVPPGLAGHTPCFMSFSIKPCGNVVASNLLCHTF